MATGLGCCGFGGLLFAALSRGAGGWRSLRLTMLLPLGLLLMGQGLWLSFGREEWWVGADLLEVHWKVLGVRRTRRFQRATLRLSGAANRSASRAQRRLLVAARAGGRSSDAPTGWTALYVSDQDGGRCLASCSRNGARPEELRSLGELLSEQTGWQLLLPARRRKR